MMLFETCPNCGKIMKCDESMVGKRVRCPCGNVTLLRSDNQPRKKIREDSQLRLVIRDLSSLFATHPFDTISIGLFVVGVFYALHRAIHPHGGLTIYTAIISIETMLSVAIIVAVSMKEVAEHSAQMRRLDTNTKVEHDNSHKNENWGMFEKFLVISVFIFASMAFLLKLPALAQENIPVVPKADHQMKDH